METNQSTPRSTADSAKEGRLIVEAGRTKHKSLRKIVKSQRNAKGGPGYDYFKKGVGDLARNLKTHVKSLAENSGNTFREAINSNNKINKGIL